MNLTELQNTGVSFLNMPGAPVVERTVVVLGAPRGGTSMVAGALHRLGVVMGSALSSVYEDAAFSHAVESGSPGDALVAAGIAERNQAHPVWGWKRPASIRYIAELEPKLRNPCYVVVLRDIFAISNRNRISADQSDVLADMQTTLNYYQNILDFIKKTQAPVMLVSYEKALQNPANVAESLSAFVGVGTIQQQQAAIAFIQPSPSDYLKESRVNRSQGSLDVVQPGLVVGWASLIYKSDRFAKVRIQVNGREHSVVDAVIHRPDIQAGGLHPTGLCGFALVLPEDARLQPGDAVTARVIGDAVDLHPGARVVS